MKSAEHLVKHGNNLVRRRCCEYSANASWHQAEVHTLCKALLGVHVQERVCVCVPVQGKPQ